jgi:hypothetical protein
MCRSELHWRASEVGSKSISEGTDCDGKEKGLFLSTLTASEARVWRSGHRLSRRERNAILETMTPAQITEGGFRFADESTTTAPERDPALATMRRKAADTAPPLRKLNILNFLMDA